VVASRLTESLELGREDWQGVYLAALLRSLGCTARGQSAPVDADDATPPLPIQVAIS
jgi:hypothetical protein